MSDNNKLFNNILEATRELHHAKLELQDAVYTWITSKGVNIISLAVIEDNDLEVNVYYSMRQELITELEDEFNLKLFYEGNLTEKTVFKRQCDISNTSRYLFGINERG